MAEKAGRYKSLATRQFGESFSSGLQQVKHQSSALLALYEGYPLVMRKRVHVLVA